MNEKFHLSLIFMLHRLINGCKNYWRFFIEMYLISVVLLLLLSSDYDAGFLAIKSIVFGKLITPSNQLSRVNGLLDSHAVHPKVTTFYNFPMHENASKARILQEKSYLDDENNMKRSVRNLKGHKPNWSGRRVLKKHRTHSRKSRTRAKNRHRWKGSSKKLRYHNKVDDNAVASKSRDSSALQKLQDKYEEMGSDDLMIQDTDESHGRESRNDAQLLFLAILIIITGSFFLVFICAKFYPGLGRRLIPFERYNGYKKLAGEDDIENEKLEMQGLDSSCLEQEKTTQFEQPSETQGENDPSKGSDETPKLLEQLPSSSQEDKKNVVNLSSFTDSNGNSKEARESSAFSRMLPIYMGKYRSFQAEDEESGPAHQLHSSSESDLSGFSIDNWSWPTRIAKTVLRSISNMISSKRISESQRLRENPSRDTLIEMNAISMENLARDSISQPFQVQNPIESMEYDKCMKFMDEGDYVKLTIPYDMTHEFAAKERICNLESFKEFYGTMGTKSNLDKQKERRNSGDVEDWCQEKPKRKRRKQNIREEIAKKQKCNDEKEFIYVIHDAVYENSESEWSSKETMSAEYKRSRHIADSEMKPLTHKNNKMCDRKSDTMWQSAKTAKNGCGEKCTWSNGANSNKNTQIDHPLISDRKHMTIRDLERKGNNCGTIEVPVVIHNEQSLRNIYSNKPVRKVFVQDQRNRGYDSYIKRGHRSRSYTLGQTKQPQHAVRVNRRHSLSSIPSSNNKTSHSTYVEQDSRLSKEDNGEIQLGSINHSQLPAPVFDSVHIKRHCLAKRTNAENDELSLTRRYEQQNPSVHYLKRNRVQSIAFQKQKATPKKRLPLSDNLNTQYHGTTPVEAENGLRLQKTLSSSSLWRISPENSTTSESMVMLNRASGSSSSFLCCELEELVVARETREDPGQQAHPKEARKDYEHGEDYDDYYEYDWWLQSRGSNALHSRKGSDRIVSNRQDSGIGSLSRSTDRASAILKKTRNDSNKSLKYKGENASAIQLSGKLYSVSNKSIQTVQPRSESGKRWTFVRKLFRSKTSASKTCAEEKSVMKKNSGKCKKMQKKLIRPKIQKKLKVK